MLRFLANLFAVTPCEGRSPQWSKERAAWLADNPECAACGGTEHVTVHHVRPFHLYPSLELVRSNFITLCENPTHNCHLIFGHFLAWTRWNPSVRMDVAAYRKGLEQAKRQAA